MPLSADAVRKGEGKVALGAIVNCLLSVLSQLWLARRLTWKEPELGNRALRLIVPAAQAWCQTLTALALVTDTARGPCAELRSGQVPRSHVSHLMAFAGQG